MRGVAPFVLAVGLTVCATSAAAQSTAVVTPVAHSEFELRSPWLTELRSAFAKGDTDSLGKKATEFMDELNNAYKRGAEAAAKGGGGADVTFYNTLKGRNVVCCDYEKNYYLVMFGALDPQNKAALAATLVHAPEPKSTTVLGLPGPDHALYEIFIAEDTAVTINGYYDIKRVEDPALKATADFVSTVLGKLGLPNTINKQIEGRHAIMMMNAPPPPGGPEPTPFRHAVSIGKVTFGQKRVELTGHHTVSVTDPLGHLQAAVDNTAVQLRDRETAFTFDNVALTELFNERVRQQKPLPALKPETVNKLKATPPPPPPPQPGQAPATTCSGFVDQVSAALKKALAAESCAYLVSDQSGCVADLKKAVDATFKEFKPAGSCTASAARDIAVAFETAVQPDLTKVTGTNALTLQPLQRFGFGLATGYLAGIQTDPEQPRTSIQSGKIATDPFVRSITMGLVNLPLWGYDASSPTMTGREKFKPFVGFAFTPYFGMTTGGGWFVSRYLGVNVGYARLWYDTPKATEQVDQAPVDKAAPFRLAGTNAWFVAASYNFSGGR